MHPPAQTCARVRSELEHVFPLLDGRCQPAPINGKLEEKYVYQCAYGDGIVRYSRWLSADDPNSQPGGPESKYAYFRHTYYGDEPWLVHGRPTGDQWTTTNSATDAKRPYVWVGVYDRLPYSVIVKSTTMRSRDAWQRRLQAKAVLTRDIERP